METTQFKPIVTTIWGVELQTCQLKGIPYSIRPKSTLNERFGVQQDVLHSEGQYPKMQYACIGNGGHRSKIGADGIEVGEINQHKPRHSGLFKFLPFVVREPNNDLTPQERERFGMRLIKEHNGRPFIFYYLRRLDYTTDSTQLQYRSIVNEGGQIREKIADFVATDEDLYPVPEPLKTVGVNTLNGDYVRCESVIKLAFNEWDLRELKNAANILFGSERYAIISEVGLVSGVDRNVEGTSGVGNTTRFNYKEVISAQICAFISTDFSAYYHSKAAELVVNVGTSEPLFSLVAP